MSKQKAKVEIQLEDERDPRLINAENLFKLDGWSEIDRETDDGFYFLMDSTGTIRLVFLVIEEIEEDGFNYINPLFFEYGPDSSSELDPNDLLDLEDDIMLIAKEMVISTDNTRKAVDLIEQYFEETESSHDLFETNL